MAIGTIQRAEDVTANRATRVHQHANKYNEEALQKFWRAEFQDQVATGRSAKRSSFARYDYSLDNSIALD